MHCGRRGACSPHRYVETHLEWRLLGQPEDLSGLSGFMRGAKETLLPFQSIEEAKQVGSAVWNDPVAAVKAIFGGAVDEMGEQWEKAGEAYQAGNYGKAIGHGMAGSIPIIGPASARAGGVASTTLNMASRRTARTRSNWSSVALFKARWCSSPSAGSVAEASRSPRTSVVMTPLTSRPDASASNRKSVGNSRLTPSTVASRSISIAPRLTTFV
jgi:hypothetical protein